jgi:voltage-gated potassium channel
MLRPLRILRSARLLRILRLVRLVAFAAKGLHETRGIVRHRGLNWVLLIVLALNLIAAAAVLEFERGNPEANIDSYPDALWWAVTTITTVGYGDRFPTTPAGRGVAVFLMVAGIAMFGGHHRHGRGLLRGPEGRGGPGRTTRPHPCAARRDRS